MNEALRVPPMESVLREERSHRLGVCSEGEGRRLVLQTYVGDVQEPLAQTLLADVSGVPGGEAEPPRSGVLSVVFDCVSGERLSDLFGRLELSEGGRRALLLMMVRAVARLHSQGRAYGLCHPGYVLATRDGAFQFPEPFTAWALLHGGVSANQGGRLGTFKGVLEPWYVAPEWVRSGTRPTFASDVFQLAVLLAQDALGTCPFGEGLTLEVANRVMAGNPAALLQSRHRFSSYWGDVLLRALRPDPAQRFRDAGEFLEALQATPEADGATQASALEIAERPYWQLFEAVAADKSTWSVPAAPVQHVTEGRLLVEQLARLKVERQSAKAESSGKWGWWLFSGGLAVVAGLGFWLLPGLGDAGRQYEGTRTDGEKTITHQLASDTNPEAIKPGLSEENLLNGLPARITKKLTQLEVPLSGELAFEPPVLPPYRVRVRAGEGKEALLEFASRDKLSRVILVGADKPQLPASFTVLYDASGEPKALMPYDPMGYVLPVLTLPEASVAPPVRK